MTNLQQLKVTDLPHLIKQVITTTVPPQWYETLWRYLANQHPRDLSSYEDLKILALDNLDMVVTLSKVMSKVIMKKRDTVTLGSSMSTLLRKLGFHVVDSLPWYVEKHPAVLGTYVKIPTAEQVTDLLLSYSQQHGVQTITQQFLDLPEASRDLIELLSRATFHYWPHAKMQLLRVLPVFQTTHSKQVVPDLARIEDVKTGIADHGLPFSLPCRLLFLPDNKYQSVAQSLGVEIISLATLVTNYLIPYIMKTSPPTPKDEIQTIMTYVFQNIFVLQEQDPSILRHLSHVAFVDTSTGSLAEPCCLFDPHSRLLQDIFVDAQHKFPHGLYVQPHNLAILLQMGLKKESELTVGDLKVAMETCEHAGSDQVRKAKAILDHLGRVPRLLSNQVDGISLLQWCGDYRWLPVMQTRPSHYPLGLPWAGKNVLCNLSEVILPCWATLAGMSRSVLAPEVSSKFASSLGLNHPPPLDLVMQQLQAITERYHPDEKHRYLTALLDVYKHLQKLDPKCITQALSACPKFLWVENEFTNPNSVVLVNQVMDLQPHLYTFPRELKCCQQLFLEMGMKEEVDGECLVYVLHKIKSEYENESIGHRSPRKDLQLAIAILNYMRTIYDSLTSTTKGNILVPIKSSNGVVLRSPKDCAYCNADWLTEDSVGDDEMQLVHGDLPLETAITLEVPSFIKRHTHGDEMHFEGFGQTESLVNRLKHLLEDYTDGFSIIKEMVQNADDAGASTVKFLYDERTNDDATIKLLDPGMKECQGPALWVYNDAEFTDEDFQNIKNLGNTTKEEALDKVGQFGLGFNSVYNMTDVPSFISRESVVILDRHMTHLGKEITKGEPGIRLRIPQNKAILKRLTDQFKPFSGVFDCSFFEENSSYYRGTLFRLPLRTHKQAASSQICNIAYDQLQVRKLLNMLIENAHQLILFTQNIKCIELYHLPPEKQPQQTQRIVSVDKAALRILQGLSHPGNTNEDPCSIMKLSSKYVNSQSSGNHRASMVIKTSKTIRQDCELLLDIKGKKEEDKHWLLSSVIGKKPSLFVSKKLLPLCGVATMLKEKKNGFIPQALRGASSGRGQLFTGMPLPVYSGLPMHINGMFALQSSRRGLAHQTSDDIGQSRTLWNKHSMEGVLSDAYMHALQDTVALLPVDTDFDYHTMWPVLKRKGNDQEDMTPFIQQFYQRLPDWPDFPLVHTSKGTVKLVQAVLVDESLMEVAGAREVILETFNEFLPDKTPVVLPDSVFRNLMDDTKKSILDEKRYDFNQYFGSVFFPNLSKIQEEKRETVMSFAVNCPKELDGYLSGLGVDKCLDLLLTFKMAYTNQLLHDAALHLVSEILVATDHAMEKEKVTPKQLREAEKTIYLPDEDGILASSVQLCFTDIHERSTRTTTHKVKLVHNCVSRRAVIGLGVKNRRDQMIDTFSTGLPFGQSEDLTNAIKRVLHAYPDDHAILKELIQNADDAKATKIHFIWDPRTHSSENLFSESWEHLQGPALCVHNNSPFTQEDVEAIQNFGMGCKGGDPSKTGQYGIGFCSVFHLTDVPSILTSGPDLPETLCVFDPHCTFVPGATKQKPGRQYKYLSELREEFPDVFSCYLGQHFETENATMMRFPLRNVAMAAKSKISRNEHPDMINILENLKKESARILIFVNHLQNIEISTVDMKTGRLVLKHSVQSVVCKESLLTAQHMDGQAAMAQVVQEAMMNMKLKDFNITHIPRQTTVTMLDIVEPEQEKQTYCVAQCIGIGSDTELPASVEEAITERNLALLPRGGVAAPVVQSNHSTFESTVFCFLPTPLRTDLPVHVNGHFALDHEDRRHLSETEGYKRDWNKFLCEQIISVAYVKLLDALKCVVNNTYVARPTLEEELNSYQFYFPKIVHQAPLWNILSKACYQQLERMSANVLPVVVELSERKTQHPSSSDQRHNVKVLWYPLQGRRSYKVYFPESAANMSVDQKFQGMQSDTERVKAEERVTKARCELERSLLRCGFGLLQVTDEIADTVRQCDVEIHQMSPTTVLDFFGTYNQGLKSPCKMGSDLPAKVENTSLKKRSTLIDLLKYLKTDPEFLNKLEGTPLLLTADHFLRVFSRDYPVCYTPYTDLLQKSSDSLLDRRQVFFEKIFSKDAACVLMKPLDIETLSKMLKVEFPGPVLQSGQ